MNGDKMESKAEEDDFFFLIWGHFEQQKSGFFDKNSQNLTLLVLILTRSCDSLGLWFSDWRCNEKEKKKLPTLFH